jgi:preprotein translocase subunit SecE
LAEDGKMPNDVKDPRASKNAHKETKPAKDSAKGFAKEGRDAKPSKVQAFFKGIAAIPKRIRTSIMNTVAELKKVTWPTRQDLINYTTVVVVFMVLMAVVVGLLDLGASALVSRLIGQV